ncbi:MAG: hypothetical protein ACLT98_06280 [Eggerthellaceae bacterium]
MGNNLNQIARKATPSAPWTPPATIKARRLKPRSMRSWRQSRAGKEALAGGRHVDLEGRRAPGACARYARNPDKAEGSPTVGSG